VPGLVLPRLARWAVEESAALADERSPFHGTIADGDPRVLLIVGENASGKSLAFRLVAQIADSHGIEAITLSIRERTGDGTFEMARMRRAMIYGQETTSSTGATSARVVQSGFHNMLNRPAPCLLGLDEPEIGLSDGYAEALGEYIGRQAIDIGGSAGNIGEDGGIIGRNACGVMVVTHSRRLAEGLVRGLGAEPTFVAMMPDGESAPPGLADWIASRDVKGVEDLLALRDTSLARFRQVQRILDAK